MKERGCRSRGGPVGAVARIPRIGGFASERRPHVLAAPTTVGIAAITPSTMPAMPAVPPEPEPHLDQVTLRRHRLGGCGQGSDRGSDSRYAERHRTHHKKRCRNFELGHDMPPIRNFGLSSTWLTAIRCMDMTDSVNRDRVDQLKRATRARRVGVGLSCRPVRLAEAPPPQPSPASVPQAGEGAHFRRSDNSI
jgi:hypothetical protein